MKMETRCGPLYPITVAAVYGGSFPRPAARTTPQTTPTRTTTQASTPRLTVTEAAALYRTPNGVEAVRRYRDLKRAAGVELSVLGAFRDLVRLSCSA